MIFYPHFLGMAQIFCVIMYVQKFDGQNQKFNKRGVGTKFVPCNRVWNLKEFLPVQAMRV